MLPQTEDFQNISVNIHETGFFTKFDERDPDTNLSHDITKSNFETSYLNKTEKNRTIEVHSILKNVPSYMSIFEVFNVILKTLLEILFEEC